MLDIVGDKWTLLVVRDLILGRRYFKEFLASPECIATNILTDRLSRLTKAGIVQAIPDPATVGRNQYSLTEKGATITPIIEAMADWGLSHIKGTSQRLQIQA
jgi:DNA-binding HxlR family transcriptional regulator